MEKVLGCDMYTLINFLFFVVLMTYALNVGKILGIILCLIAFLVMHVFCEEMDESAQNSNSFLDQIERNND